VQCGSLRCLLKALLEAAFLARSIAGGECRHAGLSHGIARIEYQHLPVILHRSIVLAFLLSDSRHAQQGIAIFRFLLQDFAIVLPSRAQIAVLVWPGKPLSGMCK